MLPAAMFRHNPNRPAERGVSWLGSLLRHLLSLNSYMEQRDERAAPSVNHALGQKRLSFALRFTVGHMPANMT